METDLNIVHNLIDINRGIEIMKTQNADIIKHHEGLVLHAYLCPAGVPTIGYGHTGGVSMGDVITEKKADELLKKDLRSAEYAVNKYVNVDLNQNQFDALVSFVFNLGAGNFKSSTLLRKLNFSDYDGAASEFKRWNKAGGRVLAGLTKRRLAEEKLFRGQHD